MVETKEISNGLNTEGTPKICPIDLREVWDYVGIKEDCDKYMVKAFTKVEELPNYKDEFFDALENRAICNELGKNWCGANAPISKIAGVYEYKVDLDSVAPDWAFYPPTEIVNYAKEHIREDVYAVRGDRKHLYYDENGKTKKIKISDIIKSIKDEYLRSKLDNAMKNLPPIGQKEYIFVISNDPVDIVMKSTGQAWSSCEALGREFYHGIWSDIENWNGIVYVYSKKGYKKGELPIARVMIRHCIDEDTGKVDIGVEPSAYGAIRTKSGKIISLDPFIKKGIVKAVENLLKDLGYTDYDICVTPYEYRGYSDRMHNIAPEASDVQICYGNSDRCRDEIVRDEWDEWLEDYYYEGVIACGDTDSFWQMYHRVNLSDFARDYIDSVRDFLYPDYASYEDVTGCWEVSENDSDYIAWEKHPEYLKEFVKILKIAGIDYVTKIRDKIHYNELPKGITVNAIKSDDPDNVELYDYRDYYEFNDKYEEFIECVGEDVVKEFESYPKRLFGLFVQYDEFKKLIPNFAKKKLKGFHDKVNYCLKENFGLEDTREVYKKGIEGDPEYVKLSEIIEKQAKAYEKYNKCIEERHHKDVCESEYLDDFELPWRWRNHPQTTKLPEIVNKIKAQHKRKLQTTMGNIKWSI